MTEPPRRPRVRMTGQQRREQLIAIGRSLFAEKGYDAASIEERKDWVHKMKEENGVC